MQYPIDDNKELNESAAESTPQTEEAPKPFSGVLEWLGSLVYAVIIMLVLNIFVFRSITVDGTSMNNTLQHQDKVIATNLFYTPKRGDIVVVQADRLMNRATMRYGEPIIKRVIALEGDTIRFDFNKGEVYLNGELLEEDYIAAKTLDPESCQSGVDYVVPAGHVFVMGDNRNASTDSRHYAVGFVDKDLIMGKAVLRFMPFDSMGLL